MKWLIIYAYFTQAQCQPVELNLPKLEQPVFDTELGFQEFIGNHLSSPFSFNLLTNLKESPQTIIQANVTITERGKFHLESKIVYIALNL